MIIVKSYHGAAKLLPEINYSVFGFNYCSFHGQLLVFEWDVFVKKPWVNFFHQFFLTYDTVQSISNKDYTDYTDKNVFEAWILLLVWCILIESRQI